MPLPAMIMLPACQRLIALESSVLCVNSTPGKSNGSAPARLLAGVGQLPARLRHRPVRAVAVGGLADHEVAGVRGGGVRHHVPSLISQVAAEGYPLMGAVPPLVELQERRP